MKTRREGISETTLHRLSDGLLYPAPEGGIDHFEQFDTANNDGVVWPELRDEILRDWVAERPGTRPSAWWLYDAPRMCRSDLDRLGVTDTYYRRTLPDPRRRLGGIGDADFEHLAFVPRFALGIPGGWVMGWMVEFYNGRSVDVNGRRIGQYQEGHFAGLAPDPADPPRFESQAAYLRRHDLFLPCEERRLSAGAYDPEIVSVGGPVRTSIGVQ